MISKMRKYMAFSICIWLTVSVCHGQQDNQEPVLSNERVVFQLEAGDFVSRMEIYLQPQHGLKPVVDRLNQWLVRPYLLQEFAFFPEVAPVTTAHIFKLVQLGLYTTNHFFRVDKGFVAQCADVSNNRLLPLNEQQKEYASKTVPLEVKENVKHHEGILSMARGSDPNSGSSSFFICYGTAPHLDMQYGAFGRVTRGMDVLHSLESLPTRKEGIFVMPLQRVTIQNTYWYRIGKPEPSLVSLTINTNLDVGNMGEHRSNLPIDTMEVGNRKFMGNVDDCAAKLAELKARFVSQAQEVEQLRRQLLP